jgi:FKBP-type peptidyl-prolyl cis-trans isomerase FklB
MFGNMNTNKNRRLFKACSFWILGTLPMLASGQPPAAAQPSADDASYTIGLKMGQQLRQSGVTNEISIDRVVEGLKEGLAGRKEQPAEDLELRQFLRSMVNSAAAKNAAAAKEFLQKNGKESGVKTLASGLQYRIIDPGNTKGASPQPTDRVTVQYRGTFMDGTEFDSSSRHASAAPLAVNNLMTGWQEALLLMKPGAKWQLFIPPELGYGQIARPGVPGGSLMIFDIELKKIEPPPVKPQ